MIIRIGMLMVMSASLVPGFLCQCEPNREEGDAKVNGASPLELRLTVKRMKLRAVIRNVSDAKQVVLHSGRHQPSVIVLTGPGGEKHEPFDSRTREKYDATVYRSLFEDLAPGRERKLFDAEFLKTGDTYRMEWGPWAYRKLEPGEYRVKLLWTSATTSCMDDESGEKAEVEGVWLGTIQSKDAKVVLK